MLVDTSLAASTKGQVSSYLMQLVLTRQNHNVEAEISKYTLLSTAF